MRIKYFTISIICFVALFGAASSAKIQTCGGTSPHITASTWAEFSNCSTTYTEGDDLTITNNLNATSGVTFSRGGIIITAAVECGVTISHNAGSASLITLTRDLTHDTIIKKIRFNEGASHTDGSYLTLNGPAPPATNYNPLMVHDGCFIFTDGALHSGIKVQTSGGTLIYTNIFDASGPGNECFSLTQPYSGGRCDQAINYTADSHSDSWTTPATMGTDDFDGLQNNYSEDNQFIQFLNQAYDVSANIRLVHRHNIMDESAGASHGADTGIAGVVHGEYYNNIYIHIYYGDNTSGCHETFPLSRALSFRGGSGVVTDEDFTDSSNNDGCWGVTQGQQAQVEIQNLRRVGTQFPCWGAGAGSTAVPPTYANKTYPAYHQVGRGMYNGSNPLTSTGESLPIYAWNNGVKFHFNPSNYAVTPDECGPDQADISDYFEEDRDYVLSAKPSYTKYTWPHPLREVEDPIAPTNGSARRRLRG